MNESLHKEPRESVREQVVSTVRSGADSTLQAIDQQIEQLSERLDELSSEAKKRLRSVDEHMHEKPYMYMAAASLAGLGLGYLLKRSRRTHLH